MAKPRRHFFSWDRPLLPQIVDWLAAGWDQAGPLDLSNTLAIVPTREAGRRLREALAAHAALYGRAAFPPRVATPEAVLASEASPGAASALQMILAWSEVLQTIALADFRAVFPLDPPERNFAWSLRLGRQLAQLQSTLAEAGWRLRTVAESLARQPDFPELARWEQLGELERRLDDTLAGRDLLDLQAAKIAAAADPSPPAGIERLLILAAPDPLPLAVGALGALAERLAAADLVVFAPPEEADSFDAWGRPRPEIWSKRPAPWSNFTGQVRLEAGPEAQAQRIAVLASEYAVASGALAIGVADPEVAAPLVAALSCRDLPVFNPQGRLRRQDGFYQLLSGLADLRRTDEFRVIETLGRCPEILTWFQLRAGSQFSPARWLAGLDELRSRHLPPDLTIARRQAAEWQGAGEVAAGLALLADLRSELQQPSFASGVAAALALIFAGRRIRPLEPQDAQLGESAAAWMDLVRQCGQTGAELHPNDWWDLALRLYGDQPRSEEKPVGALELQGWIELLWEEAPHLAIAGLNDGMVPDAIVGDPFLPESLRERLGLKTNAARLARDAYLLYALASSRRSAGRLDLLVGKYSAAGEPLRPSRLLLLGPDEELSARVGHLFRSPAPAGPPLPWTRAWQLAPPAHAAPPRISVTALRGWLDCPFRFYLRHVLKMEAVDAAKSEMDQLDFGTLCHAALEAMGREEALTHCGEPEPLREFLPAALDREARRKFGELLPLPLLVQLESARQRLSWLAEAQAAEQAKGWRIVAVEKKVTVTIEGLEVVAKVDRIDRHQATGAVRVLDYKTSDSAVNPAAAHLRSPGQMRELPAWAQVEYEGKALVWADLQLPLYRHALAAEFPTLSEVGYFNLPKASADARLEWWEPYPRELQESALACAAGVCRAIRAGEFWPPNEKIEPARDPYASLFQRGVRESVLWAGGTTHGA